MIVTSTTFELSLLANSIHFRLTLLDTRFIILMSSECLDVFGPKRCLEVNIVCQRRLFKSRHEIF